MRTPSLCALLAIAAGCGAVSAQEKPPASGPTPVFALPAPKRFALDNGLRVTLVPWGSVPKMRVELMVEAGSIDEPAEQVWLSELTGRLLREGTATRTGAQVSEEAARMGGEVSVTAGADATEITGDALSEFAPEMVALVAELAQRPRFPESELGRLKADLLREFSVARTQPGQLALARFRESIYGDHPYGRVFPTDESLKALSLQQVRAFHEAGFGAARAHLYVAGRFDASAVEGAVRTSFGSWKRAAPAAPRRPAPMAARALHAVDRPGAVQSTIYMGLPVIDVSDPSYVPLLVTHTLLGGYFSSRITSNIREQKGYTYSPQAQLFRRRRDAYWAEQADVTTAVTGASLKEILFEIDRLRSEAPPPEELEAVKSYLSGTFVLQNSTRNGIIDQLELVDLNGLPESYLRDLVPRIQSVTPDEVKEMARAQIDPARMTIVVVGDLKAIDEQLMPYR